MWTFLLAAMAAPPGPAFVLGGAPADPADWPDVVALLAGGEQRCTGVLVAPDRVLTAAHCEAEIDEAVVAAGAWQDGARVAVVERVVFPDEPVDVALLTLASASDAALRPWTLPCDGLLPEAGMAAAIVGYGAIDPQSLERPGELREGRTTIITAGCDEVGLGCNGALPAGYELRAGGAGVDSCIGDSGGPLFLADGEGWRLAGTTSRGVLGQRDSCGGGGIYTRTDAISGWLEGQGLVAPQGVRCEPSEAPEACGCAHSGGGAWAGLLAALLLVRRRALGAALLAACGSVPQVEEEAEPGPPAVRTLAEVLAEPPDYGAGVIVGPLRVATGRALGTGMVYLQDPEGGRLVEVRPGRVDGWPPPVGTDITARLFWVGSARIPVMWLSTPADLLDVRPGGELRMLEAPEDPPVFALARWTGVRVLSDADPSGRAQTSLGRDLVDRFGTLLPGRTSAGALTGIVLASGDVAPRTREDWDGPLRAPPPVETTLAALRAGAHADGEQVQLLATQVAPWSRGQRYTVIQDAVGEGMWIDAEGFGHGVGAPGQLGWWTGQVARDGQVVYLRSWTPPDLQGPGAIVGSGGEDDGALVEITVSGLGAPDRLGERTTAEGWVLDDRFTDLTGLQAGRVRGVVERTTLAVLP
jgi:hypothetical protein